MLELVVDLPARAGGVPLKKSKVAVSRRGVSRITGRIVIFDMHTATFPATILLRINQKRLLSCSRVVHGYNYR
jgi:hypothetical protein